MKQLILDLIGAVIVLGFILTLIFVVALEPKKAVKFTDSACGIVGHSSCLFSQCAIETTYDGITGKPTGKYEVCWDGNKLTKNLIK